MGKFTALRGKRRAGSPCPFPQIIVKASIVNANGWSLAESPTFRLGYFALLKRAWAAAAVQVLMSASVTDWS
jgi:hypothetical protein